MRDRGKRILDRLLYGRLENEGCVYRLFFVVDGVMEVVKEEKINFGKDYETIVYFERFDV